MRLTSPSDPTFVHVHEQLSIGLSDGQEYTFEVPVDQARPTIAELKNEPAKYGLPQWP